ncbi:MAG: beta-ketoacyl-[acyl-carrier-protein] synthase family protein [Polyangiaceae bacterium]|nr:beta-ketoacyl-[acyl-carrier-protein] synthase family protein [Polyangiaceae bacterium]
MRLWITGIGIVSPLAVGARATMDRLLAGERAFAPLSLFDTAGCRSRVAAEVRDLRVADVAPRGAAAGWSRTDAMAAVAAREALGEAGVTAHDGPLALGVGGTTAGMLETESDLAELWRNPGTWRPTERMLSHPLSATADALASILGPFRRVRTVCSACSSGANALILAAAWLRSGRSERVLAGAADGLCRLTFTGFSALGAMSPEPCRPFDLRRDGLSLGEGAAFALVETEASARARGAEPLCELAGWAARAEAHHITNPEPTGRTAAEVMSAALARAGLAPSQVGYLNAHGTATRLNDSMEAAAIRQAFGPAVAELRVSSSKGQVGHTLGAAGALEAAIAALALRRSAVPPTMGLREVDPECALRHLFVAEPVALDAVMSSSFGFGGSDTALVLCRPGFAPVPAGARAGASPPTPARVLVSAAATVGPEGVLGTVGGAVYLVPVPGSGPAGASAAVPPAPARLAFEARDHLDVERARRVDRTGRLAIAAAARALRDGGLGPLGPEVARGVGAVAGGAFGTIDACCAFVQKFLEKGARFASPAEFPNLVPSSPVAHTSIYAGLGGMVISSHDLAATAESALATAVELLEAGEGAAVLAGSVEEASVAIEDALAPMFAPELPSDVATGRGRRSEGAALLLLETEASLAARGGVGVAEVVASLAWRGTPDAPLSELAAPGPGARAAVVTGRYDALGASMLERSAWRAAPRHEVAPRVGWHEAAGGMALAAAVGALAAGRWDSVLVLGLGRARGYAFVLQARARASAAGPQPEPLTGDAR